MRAEQYSQSATMDVRDACALALKRMLEGIDRVVGGERVKFVQVFDEWATYQDQQDTPTACVVPPADWTYDDTGGAPKLLEKTVETWPVEVEGEPPSFGLYKTAEMVDEFTIAVRASSTAMRSMIKLAVEDSFQTRNVTMDPDGQRYGLLLDLPEYWGVQARVSLIRGANADDEDTAIRNRRDAAFVVSMQAPKVQLGAVTMLSLTIRKEIQTASGQTISVNTIVIPPPERS